MKKTYNQLTQRLDEILTKSTPAGEWIHDFVHSDNPKFAGKSAAKRKQMALAAYYSKQREQATEGYAASQNSIASEMMEDHLVHVNDGSKYDEEPHEKDVAHVMAGVKHHGGEFGGHSDKGAFFKFKSKDAADAFRSHVNKCPNKSCDAEHVTEEVQIDEEKWHVYDTKTKAVHSTHTSKSKAEKAYNELNDKHKGYDTPGGLVQGKYGMRRADVKEDVQIDEVSKSTLMRYIPKASRDVADNVAGAKEHQVTMVHATHAGNWDAANKASDKSKVSFKKAMQRLKGIDTATKKLGTQKEEVEINEISKETLGSYVRKASLDMSKNDAASLVAPDKKTHDTELNKGTKRYLGLSRAVDKLTKEEAELSEDQYTSEYKIKYYVDPITGENKTRKLRPHRVNFAASKMRGEPAQKDAQGDYGAFKEDHSHKVIPGTEVRPKVSQVKTQSKLLKKEEVTESRSHKVLATFFKNREIANQTPEQKAEHEKKHHEAMVKAHNEYVKKNPNSIFKPMKESVNPALMAILKRRQEAQAKKDFDLKMKKAQNSQRVNKALSEGFDDYDEIAKELIKRHGKNIDTGHINDLAGERDTHRGLDHAEVMAHVKKHLKEVEMPHDERWTQFDRKKHLTKGTK